MSDMWSRWKATKAANPKLAAAEQIRDPLISSGARVLREKPKGVDREYRRLVKKKDLEESAFARVFDGVVKKFLTLIEDTQGAIKDPAAVRQDFADWLTSAVQRRRGPHATGTIVDPAGHVSGAVRLAAPPRALGAVLGQELVAALDGYRSLLLKRLGLAEADVVARQAEALLSRFFAVWDKRRSAQHIKEIMDAFATQHEPMRQQIRKLLAKGDKASTKEAADLRRVITDRLRGRFDTAREGVLKDVLAELHDEVKGVGFAIEARGTGSISFTVNLGQPQMPHTAGAAAPLKPPPDVVLALNIDHARIDFADALNTWIDTGSADRLHAVLSASNMRIATAMENQVLFNQLKSDLTNKSWLVQPPPKSADELAAAREYLPNRFTFNEAEINKIIDQIEALLGRKLRKTQPGVLGPELVLTEEGTLVRDLIMTGKFGGAF